MTILYQLLTELQMFLEKRILTEICSQLLQQTKMTAEILSQMEMRWGEADEVGAVISVLP